MSTTADLVTALKKELKAAHMTYADLARELGMAESSVKRMLAKGDMPLSRIDAICRALKLDFAEVAQRVADAQPLLKELTAEQERAVVADEKLLLVATNVLSQWTLEQMTAAYRLTEAEVVKYLAQLDRIGVIELKPLNRYRLKLAKTFRWRPHGPVMQYVREHAVLDYFSGGFDGPAEGLLLVHGSVSRALAPAFLERLQRVAQAVDADAHAVRGGQRLVPPAQRDAAGAAGHGREGGDDAVGQGEEGGGGHGSGGELQLERGQSQAVGRGLEDAVGALPGHDEEAAVGDGGGGRTGQGGARAADFDAQGVGAAVVEDDAQGLAVEQRVGVGQAAGDGGVEPLQAAIEVVRHASGLPGQDAVRAIRCRPGWARQAAS